MKKYALITLFLFSASTVVSNDMGGDRSREVDMDDDVVLPLGEDSEIFEAQPYGVDLDEDLNGQPDSIEDAGDVFSDGIVLDVEIDQHEDAEQQLLPWHSGETSPSAQQQVDRMLREAAFNTRLGNLTASLELYERVIELDPANDFARFNMGTALIQLGRYREALEVLYAVMERNPNNYMVRNNIGWIYATADDIAVRDGTRALSHARYALMLAPSDYHVWNTLSQAYFVSARYERALRSAEIAVQIATNQGEPPERMRSVNEQLRKCRQAVATMSIIE